MKKHQKRVNLGRFSKVSQINHVVTVEYMHFQDFILK